MQRTCYFHAGCPDGFGAAWAVRRAWGSEGRYLPRSHDDRLDPQSVEGDQVVFVDIAPGNDELRALGEAAAQVIVLDHHVSAQKRFQAEPSLDRELARMGHRVHFELEHSGAMLAWIHFHPGEPAPDLLRYVEDQDLWHWKLPRSEEINAAIGSYPLDFDAWDALAGRPASDLVSEGEVLVRQDRLEVQRALRTAHPVALDGGRIEAVNALRNRSSIGHELAQRARFGRHWGLVYRLSGTRVDASIYSIGDLDVSLVAARHGGGGHRNAAGFHLLLEEWMGRLV